MKPRTLPLFLSLLICSLICQAAMAQTASTRRLLQRTHLQRQDVSLLQNTGQGFYAQAQATEDLPLPDGIPAAPLIPEPEAPVQVAPTNGFPISTLPDNFGSAIGLVDESIDPEEKVIADSLVPAQQVADDAVPLDSSMEISPGAVPAAPDSFVQEAFAGPNFDMMPQPQISSGSVVTEGSVDNECDCEICQLKRDGYEVISREHFVEEAGRKQFTKCASPGDCSICDANNCAACTEAPGRCLIGGWLAWGAYFNSHGLRNSTGNAPLGFNNISNQPQLHQAWIYAERPLLEDEASWGYRTDFLFGSDGPDTQAFGDNSWDGSWDTSGEYGFAMPQLYLQASWEGWRAKIGRFYTIIGYETVQAPDNFFYSHAYTMYYNEPFTHTGFLFDRDIGDDWTIYAGWTNGWDNGFANEFGGSTFLGGFSYSPTDNFAFTYTTSFGDSGVDLPGSNEVYMHSLIFDFAFGDGWNYIFQSDLQVRESDSALAPGVFNSKQYGVNQYLIKKINCRWSAGTRIESFYAGEGNGEPLNRAIATPGSHYHAITFGLNYRPNKSLLVKPEMRYDWVDFDGPPGGTFANGTKRSQFGFGLQSVWSW